jgi:hypothetical protein
MRMPKATRVAFDGEMLFVTAITQVELLSPSGGFRKGEHFSIVHSGGGNTATTAAQPY